MNQLHKNRTFHLTLGVIGILLTGILMTNGLKSSMDIFFLDESSYLVRGTKMFGSIPKRWGPLYCAWYRILYIFEENLVDLFYLNFKWMAILPSTLLFLALSRFSKSAILPLLIALSFLVSNFNLPVYPKISFYCSAIILSVLWASSFCKEVFYKALLFLSAALLLSFARPEFYLSFLLIIPATIVVLAIKKVKVKKQYVWAFSVFLLSAIILHIALGNPMLMKIGGHNRSLIAFGEHFAYNYAQWNNIDLYTWLAWEDIFREHFGNANSLTAAIQANFSLFWKHITSNLGEFISSFSNLVTSLIIPLKISTKAGIIVGIGILLFIVISISKNLKKVWNLEILFLLLLALPAIISSILIYPRNHYLVLLVPLVGTLLIASLNFIATLKKSLTTIGIIALVGLFVLLGPKAGDYKYFEIRKEEGILNNQMAVAMFQNVTLTQPVTMLSNEGDFAEFAHKKIRWIVPSSKKQEGFSTFLENENPDIIYLTQSIYKNPYYANDQSWNTFLKQYEEYGYQKKMLDEEVKEFFLIKSQLINYFNK